MLKYKIFVCGKGTQFTLSQWDSDQPDFNFDTLEYTMSCMKAWEKMGELKLLPAGYYYVVLPVYNMD